MKIMQPLASLEASFGDLPDPRVVGCCDHVLVEIIMVAVCAVLCGAESWSEVEEFGAARFCLDVNRILRIVQYEVNTSRGSGDAEYGSST
jgi:hypothetical protein